MNNVYINSISIIGSGIKDWQSAKKYLRKFATYVPAPIAAATVDFLPAAERRRLGAMLKLALATANTAVIEAKASAENIVSVFSSSSSDTENCHAILQILASDERQVSPTRFHNSVHNAAAGYWHIAYKNMEASTSICAYNGSFSAGLIEAISQCLAYQQPILMLSYDMEYPSPLHLARPEVVGFFATAMVIDCHKSNQSIVQIATEFTNKNCDKMPDIAFEKLRLSTPSARCLPLYLAIANEAVKQNIVIDYLPHSSLQITIQKC